MAGKRNGALTALQANPARRAFKASLNRPLLTRDARAINAPFGPTTPGPEVNCVTFDATPARSMPPSVIYPQIVGCYVTGFVPHTALKLIV